MSVCVDLIGRLGNNLFQIAAAVGYAEKHHVDFIIPQWQYANCFKTDFTSTAAGKVNWGENGFCYQEIPFIEDVKLFGYFQSEKYFKNCEKKIRELFQFNDIITDSITSRYIPLIRPDSITCSIHVRRGDYVGNNYHEVCHLQYYVDAIEMIRRKELPDLLLVFSDDISWCKENLQGQNLLFVEGNSNVEDLFLMSRCTHNIICNSSFSWWGAWLNSNKDKIVIAPDKWFGHTHIDTKDLLPEEWIKIQIK